MVRPYEYILILAALYVLFHYYCNSINEYNLVEKKIIWITYLSNSVKAIHIKCKWKINYIVLEIYKVGEACLKEKKMARGDEKIYP